LIRKEKISKIGRSSLMKLEKMTTEVIPKRKKEAV